MHLFVHDLVKSDSTGFTRSDPDFQFLLNGAIRTSLAEWV